MYCLLVCFSSLTLFFFGLNHNAKQNHFSVSDSIIFPYHETNKVEVFVKAHFTKGLSSYNKPKKQAIKNGSSY